MVFASPTQLSDEFIWLITSVNQRKIKISEVEAILQNNDYSISQKFFHLFYDIVFRYEPPQGFYWSDKNVSLSPLSAIFKDKKDFCERYCRDSEQGAQFRIFYAEHKKEILHFFKNKEEEELFDDMTLILAKEKHQIVLIDKDNNYTPTNLGTIDKFIGNMYRPTEFSLMKNMVEFLRKYYVTNRNVTLRDTAVHPFRESTDDFGSLHGNDLMYRAAKLSASSSYASEYDCYLTLLHEYIKITSPDNIEIGELHFTKSNFSNELTQYVLDLCMAYFGDVDVDKLNKLIGRAWLAKSIYERKILSNFVCENSNRIDNLFSLIEEGNLNYKNYYSNFDNPKFTIGQKNVTIHDYMAEIINNSDIYAASVQMLNDPKVTEYFEAKIHTSFESDFEKSVSKFQEQYDNFNN